MHCGMRFLLEIAVALLVHELGHIAAIKICKGKFLQIKFSSTGIGVKAKLCADCDNTNKLFVAAMGPAANLSAFFAFYPYSRNIAKLCIALAVYSLIPLEGFDGGDILSAFFCLSRKAKAAIFFAYLIAMIAFLSLSNLMDFTFVLVFLYLILLLLIGDETA